MSGWQEMLPAGFGNGISIIGLVASFWWLLASGRLVTRREHENMVRLKNEQVAFYKAAAETHARHAEELAEVGRLQLSILASIEQLAEAEKVGGE